MSATPTQDGVSFEASFAEISVIRTGAPLVHRVESLRPIQGRYIRGVLSGFNPQRIEWGFHLLEPGDRSWLLISTDRLGHLNMFAFSALSVGLGVMDLPVAHKFFYRQGAVAVEFRHSTRLELSRVPDGSELHQFRITRIGSEYRVDHSVKGTV